MPETVPGIRDTKVKVFSIMELTGIHTSIQAVITQGKYYNIIHLI